ncbi:MAG: DUF6268 family outer membrane beta-barrel protein [Cyclobacteriaceae bacterium]|nr:DUF6268 family outer membrane beta-barrel protein [Cyclobacteriaceae bacterium]
MYRYVVSCDRCILTILVAVVPSLFFSVNAQNYVDLIRVDYSLSKGNDFKDEAGSSDVQEWVVDTNLPIVLSEKSTLVSGFLFENVKVTAYPGEDEVSLYTLNLKLGLNQTYSEKWSATYILLPKISSDLESFGSNDFQFGLVSIFKMTKRANLNYKFGAYYNTELSGPFLVPLFGVYYKTNRWETNIVLPISLDINYALAKTFRVGFKFSGFQKSFHLNGSAGGTDEYLTKANNELGTYLGWNYGRINIMAMIGHSIGRHYRTYAIDDKLKFAISVIKIGDERTQLNTDFKDGMVFKTTLLYRYPVDQKKDK